MTFLLTLAVLIGLLFGVRFLWRSIRPERKERAKRTLLWAAALAAGGFLLKLVGGKFLPILNAVMFFAPFFAPVLERWASRYRAETTSTTRASSAMTREEACQVLGVSNSASEEEIRDAYKRLMMKNHPDGGGTDYLAQKINQARDTLLKS